MLEGYNMAFYKLQSIYRMKYDWIALYKLSYKKSWRKISAKELLILKEMINLATSNI